MIGTDRSEWWGTLTTYAWDYKLLLVTSFIWFMVQFNRMVFPPLFEKIQTEYGVSNAETGLLFTLLLLGYALVQFPAGSLSDRYGEVRVILAGVLIFSTAALLTAVSFTFTMLLACAILIGIGTGVHKTVSINFLNAAYPRRTGRALGTLDTVGNFGGGAGPALAVVFFALALPWKGLFLVSGLLSIGLAVVLHRINRMSSYGRERRSVTAVEGSGSNGDQDPTSYAKAFLNVDLVLFVVIVSLFTVSWNGISAFLPLFLINEKGFSTSFAGLLFSGFFVVSISQVLTGDLSDRFGRIVVILGTIGLTAASLSLLLVLSSTWSIVAVVLLMGGAFHGIRPARDSYLMDIIPESVGGGVLGIVRTVMTGVGALSPAAVGFMADQVGLKVIFTGFVAILSFCGLLTIVLLLKTK